ncbi:TetR/AcrR family transcriptional regulator [Streptomyces xiangluensis]|uniref:TetR/AcrR family transcriptional regulator n=1 Tax=Streptomyces xiangluensis TaxID=2665720 RepID=A0ABV8YYT8_9ACTN
MRALTEAETRQRIVEATVELHETFGPAKTTIKAIAERAGVQRATVYNHFPDLQVLFEACNAHYHERHPMPDPTSWVGNASPNERFRVAVRELYRWYEETETMLSLGIRDIDAVLPAAREAFVGYFRHVARSLMTGRRERGRARVRTAASIGHAISFDMALARPGGIAHERRGCRSHGGDGRRGGGISLRVSERRDDGHKHGLCRRSAAEGTHLTRVLKRKLKKIKFRLHLIDGCLAATGLIIEPP